MKIPYGHSTFEIRLSTLPFQTSNAYGTMVAQDSPVTSYPG